MKRGTVAILFAAIISLAVITRCAGLERSFVLDEFRTIRFSQLPLNNLLEAIKKDSYPPFSYVILHAWLKLSKDEAWIRLLFVLFGTGSVVLTFIIGRYMRGAGYGILAMFIASIMPMQVWVSQYARGIAPAIFFILLSSLFFLRLVRAGPLRVYGPDAVGYVAASIASIYFFYFSFFIIFSQNLIYLFLNKREIKNIFRWALLQACVGASFLPWLGAFLGQLKEGNITQNFSMAYPAGLKAAGLPLGIILRCLAGLAGVDQAFLGHTAVTRALTARALIMAVALFLAAAAVMTRLLIIAYKKASGEGRPGAARFSAGEVFIYFSVLAMTPVILSLAMNVLFKTPLAVRYFSVSSALLVFVWASALFSVRRNKHFFYIFLALFIAFSTIRLADFTRAAIDYKGSSLFLKENIKKGEGILFIGGENAYWYYGGGLEGHITSAGYIRGYGPDTGYTLKDMVDEDALSRAIEPFKILWAYNSGETMSGITKYVTALVERRGYGLIGEYRFKNISVFKYGKNT